MSARGLRASAIVVGAGIVGAACAQALAVRGWHVRVLDDARRSATAAGMGHLVFMDDNPAEIALCTHSLAQWRAWAGHLPAAAAYRACGTLWVAADDTEAQEAQRKQARLQAQGVASEWLDAAALAQAEPLLRSGLAGALRVTGDAIVYAPIAARWLLHEAVGAERIRVEHATVTALEPHAVHLADGQRLQADAVVLAAGWSAVTLCPELPLRAKKGQLLITDRYPGALRHQLVELGYVSSAHHAQGPSVAFNAQPRPTGQILIGSSRSYDDTAPEVDMAMLRRMLERACAYLPGLRECHAIRSWSGVRCASPDGVPLIGAHPTLSGVWLAVGHEGLGVTTAPATAQLLAAQISAATPPFDPTPYAPTRFAGSGGHVQ
ncbi:MAG: NAD(P)/FAD-dependent oxidoreductase [Rhodoferax sp.]